MKMFLLLKLSGVRFVAIVCSVLAIYFPVLISAGIVTLDSIKIYKTHDWLNFKPTIYFKCKGENETELPDVKKKNVLYTFKGEESWQPLTNLTGKKCKRCGFYEHDTIKPDDVLSEWEFCPSDFTISDNKCSHFEKKELNATFLCTDCIPLAADDSKSYSSSQWIKERKHLMIIGLITTLITSVIVVGAIIGFKYWQKRKRQHEQARFLRLFDDSDDIEDELGIGPLSHTIY